MRTNEVLDLITTADARPLLLTGGTVVSMNPMMGDWEKADVLIGDDTISPAADATEGQPPQGQAVY